MRNGKIAMKFEDEHAEHADQRAHLLQDDDVMLVTNSGRAIRFPATDVRVFNSAQFGWCARHQTARRRHSRVDVDHPPL